MSAAVARPEGKTVEFSEFSGLVLGIKRALFQAESF